MLGNTPLSVHRSVQGLCFVLCVVGFMRLGAEISGLCPEICMRFAQKWLAQWE